MKYRIIIKLDIEANSEDEAERIATECLPFGPSKITHWEVTDLIKIGVEHLMK